MCSSGHVVGPLAEVSTSRKQASLSSSTHQRQYYRRRCPTAKQQIPERSALLRLPAEIRAMIWQHLFSVSKVNIVYTFDKPEKVYQLVFEKARNKFLRDSLPLHPLCRACKSLFNETRHLMYRQLDLSFDTSMYHNRWLFPSAVGQHVQRLHIALKELWLLPIHIPQIEDRSETTSDEIRIHGLPNLSTLKVFWSCTLDSLRKWQRRLVPTERAQLIRLFFFNAAFSIVFHFISDHHRMTFAKDSQNGQQAGVRFESYVVRAAKKLEASREWADDVRGTREELEGYIRTALCLGKPMNLWMVEELRAVVQAQDGALEKFVRRRERCQQADKRRQVVPKSNRRRSGFVIQYPK